MRLFRHIICAFALGATAAAAQPGGVSDEALKGLGTAELAQRLLPPEIAGRVVSHTLHPRRFPVGPAVEFFGAPVPYPDGTCRRERHDVSIGGGSGQASHPVRSMQAALAPRCRMAAGALFASLQPAREFHAALAALLRLREAQSAAGGGGALPFELTCRSEAAPDRCAGGARAVLAVLPLDRVYLVHTHHGGGWSAAVMPSGPGQMYWRIRIIDDAGRVPQAIDLSWEVPPPF